MVLRCNILTSPVRSGLIYPPERSATIDIVPRRVSKFKYYALCAISLIVVKSIKEGQEFSL